MVYVAESYVYVDAPEVGVVLEQGFGNVVIAVLRGISVWVVLLSADSTVYAYLFDGSKVGQFGAGEVRNAVGEGEFEFLQ